MLLCTELHALSWWTHWFHTSKDPLEGDLPSVKRDQISQGTNCKPLLNICTLKRGFIYMPLWILKSNLSQHAIFYNIFYYFLKDTCHVQDQHRRSYTSPYSTAECTNQSVDCYVQQVIQEHYTFVRLLLMGLNRSLIALSWWLHFCLPWSFKLKICRSSIDGRVKTKIRFS